MSGIHTLYRMSNSRNVLLYIGLTSNPPARFKNHKFAKSWWTQVDKIELDHFASRAALVKAERLAIESEAPLYNVHNNSAGAEGRAVEYDLCECDNCDIDGECDWCDECSGRTGAYVTAEYAA